MKQRDEAGAVSRRAFLALAATAAASVAFGSAATTTSEQSLRTLEFDHLHTGEKLRATYCTQGCYRPDVLLEIDHFLRDFRTGEEQPIDPALLDVLHEVRLATRTRAPFQVISAFRSAATNAMLREHGPGVASHSLHMVGKAIDVRLADVPTRALRDVAIRLARGGVGFYPGPDFVHLDTGRVRRW